jgi:anti-sigma factor RsiW
MPSEPRIPTEPTLEELSAYLDHELDAATEARVGEHLAGCAECTRRLDGLRETVHAVRALPMETPTRTFTIPAPRRQSFRWAPVGWIGSAAAAGLVIGLGLSHLPLQAGSASTAGSSSFYQAPATHRTAEAGAASPVAQADALSAAQKSTPFSNPATALDPTNASRRLVLGTDSASYPANGKMRVTVQLQGSPSSSTNSGDQGLTLVLVRDGVGVALNPVGVESWNGMPIFGGWYDLKSLPLSGARAGDYRLEASWTIPDGSGRVLEASVPIRLTGS